MSSHMSHHMPHHTTCHIARLITCHITPHVAPVGPNHPPWAGMIRRSGPQSSPLGGDDWPQSAPTTAAPQRYGRSGVVQWCCSIGFGGGPNLNPSKTNATAPCNQARWSPRSRSTHRAPRSTTTAAPQRYGRSGVVQWCCGIGFGQVSNLNPSKTNATAPLNHARWSPRSATQS